MLLRYADASASRIESHAASAPKCIKPTNQISPRVGRWIDARFCLFSSRSALRFAGSQVLDPGNPDGFRQTLEKCGAKIVAFRAFPDHHAYTAEDVSELSQWGKSSPASMVVCTQKDLVKLCLNTFGDLPLFALQVEIAFERGETELLAEIDRCTEVAKNA